ncbi:unnamed protein product [Pleuronectes platessa]|uniref:Uncharacterized protein n=1 Tax=Pleuronectes platessa TaxID=8262 RepID=A0A9N7UJR2_PLEPL|nr:unnamed protein product [Pleuronectes platessa]
MLVQPYSKPTAENVSHDVKELQFLGRRILPGSSTSSQRPVTSSCSEEDSPWKLDLLSETCHLLVFRGGFSLEARPPLRDLSAPRVQRRILPGSSTSSQRPVTSSCSEEDSPWKLDLLSETCHLLVFRGGFSLEARPPLRDMSPPRVQRRILPGSSTSSQRPVTSSCSEEDSPWKLDLLSETCHLL